MVIVMNIKIDATDKYEFADRVTEYPYDCAAIVETFRVNGFDMDLLTAAAIWDNYSSDLSAGWMSDNFTNPYIISKTKHLWMPYVSMSETSIGKLCEDAEADVRAAQSTTLALFKIIHIYPWILDVADNEYNKEFAENMVLEQATKILEKRGLAQ